MGQWLANPSGIAAILDRTVTEDGYELTFQTNHLGHFLLTKLLLDKYSSCAHHALPCYTCSHIPHWHKAGSRRVLLHGLFRCPQTFTTSESTTASTHHNPKTHL